MTSLLSCPTRSGIHLLSVMPDSIGHPSLEQVQQILPIAIFGQRLRQLLQGFCGDPLLVVEAIDISKRTWRKIQQNLFWAFIYNLIGIPLAAMGYLSPVIAGAAMAASSVSVVSNALLLRARRF